MGEKTKKTPWHLWIMCAFYTFMYCEGVYDYFMMLGRNMNYYNSKGYGQEVVQYFTNYPISFLILYTVNIFTGVLAPILLLFKKKISKDLALISAIADTLLLIGTFTFRNRWNVLGPAIAAFDIGIAVITFLLYFYCRSMTKKGVLK